MSITKTPQGAKKLTLGLVWAIVFLAAEVGSGFAQTREIIPDWPTENTRVSRPFVPLAGQPNPDIPLPQDALLVPTLAGIAAAREDMQVALVTVDMGQGEDNPYWQMSQTALTVFLNKLATLNQTPVAEDTIWPHIPKPDPRYNGLLVLLQTKEGRRFLPFRIFMGKMGLGDKQVLAQDPGRQMEYWVFGTARIRRDQMIGANVLPVYTFSQCRLLGQRVIETTPRQCLLANNNLLLETGESATQASAKMTSFAECLRGGDGLIYTFPRRCIAKGGRVFTEPPQLYDTALPTDAPVRKKGAKRLAPNAVSSSAVSATLLPALPTSLTAPVPSSAKAPMANLGGGLLRTTSPTLGRTWGELGGPR